MRTLCIDTSGAAVIAVVEGEATLAEAFEPDTRKHAESLGVLLQETMDALDEAPVGLYQAEIGRICVGVGPGPFTGLRVGIVFASTVGRGLGVPVLGIGSLDALARLALDRFEGGTDEKASSRVLVVTDAKRKEVYWGVYEADGTGDVSVLCGPNVGPAAEALAAATKLGGSAIAGPGEVLDTSFPGASADGSATRLDRIPIQLDPAVLSRIADARTGSDFPLTPLYLRRPDIQGQPVEAMPQS